jgi:glycosyltransferase involved in cell wall biosynthesis
MERGELLGSNPGRSLSVVIPFYRGERFFQECLQSVLKQTLKADEIVVVDDGSGPRATQFLAQFLPHIDLVTLRENAGVAAARNVGLARARGEWIALLDQDDIWEPRKLEAQFDYLHNHPGCQVLHTGVIGFLEDGTERLYINKPPRLTRRDALTARHVIPSSLLIRKQVLEAVGGFDERLRHGEDDYDLVIRLVNARVDVDFMPEPLVRYRCGLPQYRQSARLEHCYGQYLVIRKHWAVFESTLGPGSACREVGRLMRAKAGRAPRALRPLMYAAGFLLASWGAVVRAFHPARGREGLERPAAGRHDSQEPPA